MSPSITSSPLLVLVALALVAGPVKADMLLDGQMESSEWDGSRRVASGPGYEIRRLDRTDGVYLGIRTNRPAPAVLLFRDGETLRVGHIGGALGEAIYRRGRLIRPLRWTLRDPATRDKFNPSTDHDDEQQRFFEASGWVASSAMMGMPGELEIRLGNDVSNGGGWQLLLSVVNDTASEHVRYPDGQAPVSRILEAALLRGDPPLTLPAEPTGDGSSE